MYGYEYNNIIDYWANQFHIYVGSDDRKSIIKLYEINKEQLNTHFVDFNSMCEKVMIESYCDMKYPTLNLYERIFSLPCLN